MENLETRLKREKVFSDEDTIIYMKQLLDALIYLRNKKIIHRDLKLANLFVKDGTNIKLGDFGLACKHENPNRKRKSICGTPNYIAPEILSGEGHTYPVDVWAVGILLYAMLIGKPPFETTNMKSTYNRIQSCMYVFPPDTSIDVEAKSLIMKVLTKHPNKRPTYESILESPYFLGESPRNPMSQIEQEGDTDQTRPKIVKPQKLNLKPQFTQKVPLKKMASYRRQNEEVAIPKLTEQVEDNKDSGKKDGQPVLERQKFYKKLFTNEFRGKMGSDSKISDMNAHTYRSSLSRKDTLISRDEIATNRAVKNEPLRISQELSKPIVSEKKINDDKDISDKMMDKGGKEQESSIIKRIMTNMTNTVNQDSPQDAPNVPQTTSAGNLITKKYAKQNSLIGKQGDSASKVNVQRHSLVVESSEAYQLGKSSINSSSLAPPESSSKKISAFDIIKNSSRVNSMTNSMIADDTVRREMVSEAKVIEPSENDRMTEEKSKPRMERDSSVKSASKKQRKMLFQRMIEDRIQSDTHREDKQVTDRLIIPGENQGQPARMRAASLRIHDADNRLIKTLLEGDTIVSPSNAEDISPENKDSLSNRDKIKHERSSSAHPALKIKSLWQTQEVEDKEEEAFEPGDYVKKWIDHSAKYGLVSIMHSGIISILFNDMTKVIFRINGEKFVYLSRSQSKQREEVRIYPLGLPPRNFEKKMGIINDIIRTLSNHQKDLNLSGGTDSFLSGSKVIHINHRIECMSRIG